MPLLRAQIRDNPWWASRAAINDDADLRRLRDREPIFKHPCPFQLNVDAVYTLRGPRQVGKTTFLKRLILNLLTGGGRDRPARAVMYLDVQGAGIQTHHALHEAVAEYIDWARTTEKETRLHVFLDEVTGVDSWGVAVRALHGRGALDNVTVIATGSHARDVKRGGETMPGRRGAVEHADWVMMPLAFGDYLQLIGSQEFESLPVLNLSEPSEAMTVAQEYELRTSVIRPLFDRYLLSGGYPHAVQAEHSDGRIPGHVYQLYQDAMVGEMRRAGHREELFREAALWLAYDFPGREFSWRDVSGATEIGSKDTAREIVENAQAAFIWHVFFRVKALGSPQEAPRSPKKLYVVDPLTWHVLRSWAMGHDDPWAEAVEQQGEPELVGQLVESAVADHLRRQFGRFVFYYRTRRGEEEIDFVIQKGTPTPALIEVKFREHISSRDRRSLAKHGGGILVTKSTFAWHQDQNVAEIPAATFLAALGGSLTLCPSAT